MENNNKELWLLKGTRLKEIREENLGLSQSRFGQWLYEHGVKGRWDEPHKIVTIASWENGRRNIPNNVLKAIRDNTEYNGFQYRWEYLTGKDDIKTIASFSSEELEDMAIELKEEIFIKTVLPSIMKYMLIREYNFQKIKFPSVFVKGMRIEIDNFIEKFLDAMEKGDE